MSLQFSSLGFVPNRYQLQIKKQFEHHSCKKDASQLMSCCIGYGTNKEINILLVRAKNRRLIELRFQVARVDDALRRQVIRVRYKIKVENLADAHKRRSKSRQGFLCFRLDSGPLHCCGWYPDFR